MIPDFPTWVRFVLEHPVSDPHWTWPNEVDNPDATLLVEYLTELFRSPELLARYDDDHLGKALWSIANECDGETRAFADPLVPWPTRRAGIRSMNVLFREVFAPRTTPALGHLNERGNSLNGICYMWWDLFPKIGFPAERVMSEPASECLGVISSALELDSVACQESALHGLGHWHHSYPEQTEALIDHYLKREAELRPELREYAMSARIGYVL